MCTRYLDHCGSVLHDPVLLVDGGAIENAVVSLVDDPGGWRDPDPGPAGRREPGEVSLNTKSCLMQPRIQAVRAGVRLALQNRDSITHNPHGWTEDARTVFNVTLLDGQLRVRRRLRDAGVYRIDCDTHSWMRAYVHAFEHPFFAVTDRSGEVRIPGVPVGTHDVRVWHEVLGDRIVTVDIEPGSETAVQVDFDPVDRRPSKLVPPGMRTWIERGETPR